MFSRDAIEITRGDLVWATSQGLLTQDQVEPLWNQWRLRQQADDRQPRFSASNVAYYIGFFIIGLGMLWILYLAWGNEWGGMVVFGIASAYDVTLYTVGHYLWSKRSQKRLAGLLFTIAVAIVPIAVYGLQYQMGLWYRPSGVNPAYYNPADYLETRKELLNVLPMELSALLAAFATVAVYPFPFLLTVPLGTIWFMVATWSQYFLRFDDQVALASFVYGFIVLAVAYSLDRSQSADGPDWAFWPYFVGAIAFWSGMTFNSYLYEAEIHQLLFCFVNIGLIFVAVILKRRIFMVLGGIGILAYVVHLNDLFQDFILFPFLLTLLGGLVLGAGVYFNRRARNDGLTQMLLDAENQENNGGALSMHELEGNAAAPASGTSEDVAVVPSTDETGGENV